VRFNNLVALRLGRRAVETAGDERKVLAFIVALRLGRRAVETRVQSFLFLLKSRCPKAWPKGR